MLEKKRIKRKLQLSIKIDAVSKKRGNFVFYTKRILHARKMHKISVNERRFTPTHTIYNACLLSAQYVGLVKHTHIYNCMCVRVYANVYVALTENLWKVFSLPTDDVSKKVKCEILYFIRNISFEKKSIKSVSINTDLLSRTYYTTPAIFLA